ncbi:MAG: type II secretion system GspH family protein [Lachnospiraceae bacterium]|nr:type II secretion system GspH family protein [Lachnospiraceae bacterium]
MKLWKNNRGFTLIEVLVSVTILAFISVPLLSYFSTSTAYNHKAKIQEGATQVGQDALEELKAYDCDLTDYDKIVNASKDYVHDDSAKSTNTEWHIASAAGSTDHADAEIIREVIKDGISYTVIAKTTPIVESALRDTSGNATGRYYDGDWANGLGSGATSGNLLGKGYYTQDYSTYFKKYVNPSMDSSKDIIGVEDKAVSTSAQIYFYDKCNEAIDQLNLSLTGNSKKVNNLTLDDMGNLLKRKFRTEIVEDPSDADKVYLKMSVIYSLDNNKANLLGKSLVITKGGSSWSNPSAYNIYNYLFDGKLSGVSYEETICETSVLKSRIENEGLNVFCLYARRNLFKIDERDSSALVIDDDLMKSLYATNGKGINYYVYTGTFNAGTYDSVVYTGDADSYRHKIEAYAKASAGTYTGLPTSTTYLHVETNLPWNSITKAGFPISTSYFTSGFALNSDGEDVSRMVSVSVYVRETQYRDDPSKNIYKGTNQLVLNENYDD